jgi:hypothetical protein
MRKSSENPEKTLTFRLRFSRFSLYEQFPELWSSVNEEDSEKLWWKNFA